MFKFLRLASKIIKNQSSLHLKNYSRDFYDYSKSRQPFKLIDFPRDISVFFYTTTNDISIRVYNSNFSGCFDLLTINDYDDTELLYLVRNLSDEIIFKDKEDILEFILENENVWGCKMFP